jgi:hypothetical protein
MSLKLKRNFPLILMLVVLVLVLVLGFGSLPVGAYTVAANPVSTSAHTATPAPAAVVFVNQVLHNLQSLIVPIQ